MTPRVLSFAFVILVTEVHFNVATLFNRQPQFSIKTEMNKAFDKSCNVGSFQIPKNTNGTGIADCLEHCLKNCSCKSFQVCHNTQCELCSTSKDETASLLSDKDDCIYAMHEIKYLAGGYQKLVNQCSGISCTMKYNCCQNSALCPKNKICKQVYNITQPWKRRTCECPDGYHGDNCDKPIKSCQGHYSKGSRKSGIYKLVNYDNSMYEVYCHFDVNGAWTLVQSHNLKNYNSGIERFWAALRKPMYENAPVSENALAWSGYRLSKATMQSIQENSAFLLFTCDFDKNYAVEKSDYLRLPTKYYDDPSKSEKIIDVLYRTGSAESFSVYTGYVGKIGGQQLNGCSISVYQSDNIPLHVHINLCRHTHPYTHCYFGKYNHGYSKCKDHQCVNSDLSTTQLWFGHKLPKF